MKMTKRIAASVAALTMAVSVMTAAGTMTSIAEAAAQLQQ